MLLSVVGLSISRVIRGRTKRYLLECEITDMDLASHAVRFELVGQGGRVSEERVAGHADAHDSGHDGPRVDSDAHLEQFLLVRDSINANRSHDWRAVV